MFLQRATLLVLSTAAGLACSGAIGGGEGGGGPGTGASGTGSPGTGTPGTGAPGTGAPGTGAPGTGAPGAPGSGVPGGPGALPPGIPAIPPPMACKATTPGPSPMRRLTRREYGNTVRDLLKVTENPATGFAPETQSLLGFNNTAVTQAVSTVLAEQLEGGAASLAALAIKDMPKLLKCDSVVMGEDNCFRNFVSDFGAHAFRRPLTQPEKDRYFMFFSGHKAKYGFAPAVELVLQAMLQSPHFLYRVEFGVAATAGATSVKLTHYEMASRLSYLLWSSMPDDALLQAAAENRLGTPAEIATQAERMLNDPKARPAIGGFYGQWLDLEGLESQTKDARIYPKFTPAMPALWRKETESFIDDLVFKGDGKLETMLQADYTFANKTLATFYGYTGPTTDATFDKVKHDGKRLGLLTQASVMAAQANENQSSPVRRGVFIRESLLCQHPVPPPDDLMVTPPAIKASQTTRERFSIHTTVPLCAGCHKQLDPVGFAFENFDGIGGYRTTDQGKPVDASGELVGTDVDGTVTGAVELSKRLAGSEQVRSCVVKKWFQYGHGREDTAEDTCSLEILKGQFKATGGNLKTLLLSLTQTPAFQFKTVGGAQ